MTPQEDQRPTLGEGIAALAEHALYHPLEMGILILTYYMTKGLLGQLWQLFLATVGSLTK